MARPRAAYVTWSGPDDEREPVLAELTRLGVDAVAGRWDDPEVAWSSYDVAVVRSTWDYTERRDDYLAWARRCAGQTTLLNPYSVLERNTLKTYLRDFAEAGLPVVPTRWVEPGGSVDGVLDGFGGELVVKPAVSAGARDTIRTADRTEAAAHASALVAAGQTAMVQPYVTMVEAEGETSLFYFDGELSHAVRRGPMLVPEAGAPDWQVTRRTPSADQLELADRALALVPEREFLLYARVDLLRDADGTPFLIELELTEPYLYLRWSDDGVARLASAIRRRIS